MTFPRLVVEDLDGGVALPEKIGDQALLCGPGTPSGQKGISRRRRSGFLPAWRWSILRRMHHPAHPSSSPNGAAPFIVD